MKKIWSILIDLIIFVVIIGLLLWLFYEHFSREKIYIQPLKWNIDFYNANNASVKWNIDFYNANNGW
jgi:uncharacterized protein YxeA